MSNKEKVMDMINFIPDAELLPVVSMLNALLRLTVPSEVEEVEPDEIDLAMIDEFERENDGVFYRFEDVLAEEGLTFDDLQD